KTSQSHGGRDLAHFAIRPDVFDVVVPAEPKVFHQADSRCQRVVIRNDRPAFEGIEEFRRMETDYLRGSETADHLPTVRTSEGVRCIEHQRQIAAASNFSEGFDVASPTPYVNANNPRSSRCDQSLNLRGIDVVCPGIEITKYGRDFLPLQCMGGGNKGERWHDHLSL